MFSRIIIKSGGSVQNINVGGVIHGNLTQIATGSSCHEIPPPHKRISPLEVFGVWLGVLTGVFGLGLAMLQFYYALIYHGM